MAKVLVEHAMPEVNGRTLHEYRFARPFLFYAWRRRALVQERYAAWLAQVPLALEIVYHPDTERIAGKLIRLFDAAGLRELAAGYRSRRLGQYTLEQQIWHVDRLLADRSLETYLVFRLYDAAFPLLNRLAGRHPDRWRDGLRIARAVGARARVCDHWEQQAEAYYYLGWLNENGASYKRGEFWARRNLALMDAHQVGDSLERAQGLSILAYLLQSQGDYAAARPLYERALAITERALGPDHPQTATSLNNLAGLLESQGDYAAARPLFERALAIFEARLGPEHPNTKIVRGNLAKLNDR
jgi:tetratricopeptide (TPR) repeat protein